MLHTSRVLKLLVALLCAGILINAPRAQQAAQTAQLTSTTEDRVALYQALLDLTNPWAVMCIAAHPDDEDGTSLIVMRHKYGAHTVSLFSTFGEGGQNAIGPELYEELGAIRARETMAAAEIQGSEPHFLGLKDFGYSKSADEAFRVWGHEEALRRMVLQIRKLRPDVIITNHSVTNNDHGHHQATARLELEAFDAAADPKRFPEQLKSDVTVWQVQRLFVRAGRSTQTDNAATVTIDPNERDAISGTSFAEEALRALQEHATQGPWPKTLAEMLRFRNIQGGKLPIISYVLTRQAAGAQALPQDSHNILDGLHLPEATAKQVEPPSIGGRRLVDFIDQPQEILRALTETHKRVPGPRSSSEIQSWIGSRECSLLVKLNLAITLSSGITTRLVLRDEVLVPGRIAHLSFVITNNAQTELRPELPFARMSQTSPVAAFRYLDFPRNVVIPPGKTIDVPITMLTPANARPSVPHAQHLYDENSSRMAIGLFLMLEVGGTAIPITGSTLADVAPPVEIVNVSPSQLVVIPATVGQPSLFTVTVQNHLPGSFERSLYYRLGSREQITLNAGVINLKPNESKEFKVSIPSLCKIDPSTANLPSCVTAAVSFFAPAGGGEELFRGALANKWRARIVPVDARVALDIHVGYIRGFDYSLPNALTVLGVESKELSVDEVRTIKLQRYSAVIVDNRVYESKPELIAANQKLLDYVKAGGTLIVFYHKSNEWNPDERRNRPQLAPYKLILGDERITDETAPITFIEPQHPLLNSPNKMGPEDFTNWIQERGLYYPKEWDANYHALLQANDPAEAPLKGGLLVADYGRGHYIYTSMVWYRELRAGVPGAYRMLANMISYGKTKP
jgi:LmbE family N-acetylglucosaminyl deacetylase